MIPVGIILWATGELIDSLSAPGSVSESWGYLTARVGVFIAAVGVAFLLIDVL